MSEPSIRQLELKAEWENIARRFSKAHGGFVSCNTCGAAVVGRWGKEHPEINLHIRWHTYKH
jgi:hypothetical protein